MGAGDTRTVVDGVTARDSARDVWKESALRFFRQARGYADADPERCQELLRKALEGWAHVVCVVVFPDFRPYDGKELRREPLAAALRRAREALPPALEEPLASLKRLTDEAHHNQGVATRPSARVAKWATESCALLLEWMFVAVLGEPVPADIHPDRPAQPAPAQSPPLRQASTLSRVTRAVLLFLALIGFFALLPDACKTSPSAKRAPDGGAEPTTTEQRPQSSALPSVDPLALVKRYENRIAAGDLDALLAVQRFPTPRWFLGTNVARGVVEDNYKVWYSRNPRRITFEECVHVVGRAALCQVRLEPPLEKHPGRVATCLVFDSEGFLVSRTELETVPACPPVGLSGAD